LSAHSKMRRTFLFAFVLLAVSALPAIANAGGSHKAQRKAPPSSRARNTSRTSSHVTRYSAKRSDRYNRATPRPVRYTPTRNVTDNPGPSSGANPAYAIGYRNGYDAGRAAALKELESQSADADLSTRPSQVSPQAAEPTRRLPATAAAVATAQTPAPATIRPPATSATDAKVPEPSDADPATGPVNRSLSEQRRIADAEGADAAYESATLETPGPITRFTLRGSLASLERQNSRLESEGLQRILDDEDLNSRIEHGLLTPLPVSANLSVNPTLPENRRYCRSWTAKFLADLAKQHAAAFHRPFQVNSAVRTVDYQRHLMRVNGNAAAAEGEIVSPHLSGATIDIGKQGMTRSELMWMRRQLFAMQNAGKIDVEEEFEQACFHITVYKNYGTTRPAHEPAQPAIREAAAPKPPAPTTRRRSSLPSSLAAGTFVAAP
jgi:hypothetical protein